MADGKEKREHIRAPIELKVDGCARYSAVGQRARKTLEVGALLEAGEHSLDGREKLAVVGIAAKKAERFV